MMQMKNNGQAKPMTMTLSLDQLLSGVVDVMGQGDGGELRISMRQSGHFQIDMKTNKQGGPDVFLQGVYEKRSADGIIDGSGMTPSDVEAVAKKASDVNQALRVVGA